MDQQIGKPIRTVSQDGKKKNLRAFSWLLGQEARWATAVAPFFIDDENLLQKVTPEQLRLLKARYSYLSHLAHEQETTPAPTPKPERTEAAQAQATNQVKPKRKYTKK